jgi:hypothetical protein
MSSGNDRPNQASVPLEVLDDLRYLDAEGHREVLRGVELLPVSLPDKVSVCEWVDSYAFTAVT